MEDEVYPKQEAEMSAGPQSFFPSESEIRAETDDLVSRLQELLVPYDPRDVIGLIWMRNLPVFGEQAKLPYIEYITLLYLTQPYPDGITEFFVPLEVLAEIENLIESIFGRTMMLPFAQAASAGGPDPLSELRFLARMEGLFVRYPAYTTHLEASLRDLEARLPEHVSDAVGWTVTEALAINDAALDIIGDRFERRMGEARSVFDELMTAVKRRRKGRPVHSKFAGTDVLDRLASLTPTEAKAAAGSMVMSWVSLSTREFLTLTAQELSDRSGIDVGRVQTFLSDLSLGFGDVSPDHYVMPNGGTPLQRRPFVAVPGGYFLPVPTHVRWAIRPTLEALINPDSGEAKTADASAWHAYDTARAEYVEDRSVNLMNRILRHSTSYTGLKYYPDAGTEAELDGLLILDDTLFILEAKAGSLDEATRRGAPSQLKKDLKKLAGDARKQAVRARDFIMSQEASEFRLQDGTTLTLNSADYRRAYLVSVTLEALDAFTTHSDEVQALGIYGSDSEPWWLVSLYDLEIIADVCEGSWQFTHFLRQRIRMSDKVRVDAYGEIELFGMYMQGGLHFDDVAKEGATRVWVDTHSDVFDELFIEGNSEGSSRPKIHQPMPDKMRAMLQDLERKHPPGYLHLAETMLDGNGRARQQLIDFIDEARRRAALDGKPHDGTLILEDGTGFTYLVAAGFEELQGRGVAYAHAKKYQMKSDRWVLVGKLIGSPGWIDGAMVLDYPWEQDDAMDEAVAASLPPLPKVADGKPFFIDYAKPEGKRHRKPPRRK